MIVWPGLEERKDWFDGVDLMLGVDNSETVACCKEGLEDGVLGNNLWIMKKGKDGGFAIENG